MDYSPRFYMFVDGSSLDQSKLTKLMDKLLNACNKEKIVKLHVNRNTFKYSSNDFAVLKKEILKAFEGTQVRFLFLTATTIILSERNEINQTLVDFHDSPLGGHQGVRRMAHKINQQFKWEGMRKDIQKYVRNCKICQLTKPKGLAKQPMQITSSSRTLFSKIHIDNIGPLPDNEHGFKYLFTFMDDLTRYFGAVPIVDHTAPSVAKALVENVILRFGIPQIIVSDLGTEFKNDLMQRTTKLLGIKHHNTSGFHPQTNGILERVHGTLKAIIRSHTNNFASNWPDYIPYAIFVINSSVNTSTLYSPHELVFSYKLSLPSNLKKAPEPVYNYDDYLSELKYKLQLSHQMARDECLKSKISNKKRYDIKTKIVQYKVGDKILITNEGRDTKLHNPFIGPFEITEIVSPVNVRIKKNNKDKIVHITRTKKFNENIAD